MPTGPFGLPSSFGASTRGRAAKNPFGLSASLNGTEKAAKRTLGIRDKQILWNRAGKQCEACGKKIEFDEMQTGHKNAHCKGGSTTMANSVCLCYRCNKLQGTDSWTVFMKKMGKEGTKTVTAPKRSAAPKKKRAPREENPFSLGGGLLGSSGRRPKNPWGF